MNDINAEYAPPMGPRFSQLYRERGTASSDSDKLRKRISAFAERELSQHGRVINDAIHMRVGADTSLNQYMSSIGKWLRSCGEDDFRDAITVVHRGLVKDGWRSTAQAWCRFCTGVFVEENIAFRVDDECIVRPFVDDEFSQSITSVLRGLGDARLRAVKAEVASAVEALGGRNADPKAAVRSTFESLEIYTKLVITTCTVRRLNRNMVTEHLVPMIQASSLDQPARESIAHLGNSLVDWLEAAHVYRHGQSVNEPAAPSPELAVALVSAGLSHLRWLLDTTSLPSN